MRCEFESHLLVATENGLLCFEGRLSRCLISVLCQFTVGLSVKSKKQNDLPSTLVHNEQQCRFNRLF